MCERGGSCGRRLREPSHPLFPETLSLRLYSLAATLGLGAGTGSRIRHLARGLAAPSTQAFVPGTQRAREVNSGGSH